MKVKNVTVAVVYEDVKDVNVEFISSTKMEDTNIIFHNNTGQTAHMTSMKAINKMNKDFIARYNNAISESKNTIEIEE